MAEKLYKWQKECLKAWEQNRHRGIVNVVTGAGKTVFALACIDTLRRTWPDTRVSIVVPTVALANQWKMTLLHSLPDPEDRPGFYGGGMRDEPDRKIMIYVVNSARNSLSGHMRRNLALGRHVFLICDECHHFQSKENRKIFGFLSEDVLAGGLYACLGLSATPFGTEHDEILTRYLGNEIYRYDFNAASAEGVVSSFIIAETAVSFLPEELEQYAEISEKIGVLLRRLKEVPKLKDLSGNAFLRAVTAMAKQADMDPEDPAAAFLLLSYQRKEISNLAQARIWCCVSLLKELSASAKILIFCERIEQAEETAAEIRRTFGDVCGVYHSQMPAEARRRVLREFRERSHGILVSCRCLDEGVDVPEADVGIVMSASAVERQRVQRLGRILRRADGKEAASLYYLYIRESSDDAAYLSGLRDYPCFGLRYYTSENVFSNDLYEYAAGDMLAKAGKRGYTKAQIRELRNCLNEGLVRTDFLLPDSMKNRRVKGAQSRHEANYWKVMKRIGAYFAQKPET